MRLLLLVFAIFLLPLNSQEQNKKSQRAQQATQSERGTQESPFVVKVLPTPKSQEEATHESNDRKEKSANDRHLVDATYVLAGIGILQLFVFGYQAIKLKQTVESAGEQAEAMERHIGEAARSATAMENIVTTIQTGNQALLRARLTVVIGSAVYQERRPGQTDLKFEGKPSLVNTGNTPARNVRIRIQADVLTVPIPDGFMFPLPSEPTKEPAGVVGPQHTYMLSAMVKDFVPDAEVAAIKEGSAKALHVWGIVNYDDIFGDSHMTKFGQWLTWVSGNLVMGYYIPGQNDAD